MKKLVMMMWVIVGMSLAGCNTVQGFGKDMQKAGEKVERAGSNK